MKILCKKHFRNIRTQIRIIDLQNQNDRIQVLRKQCAPIAAFGIQYIRRTRPQREISYNQIKCPIILLVCTHNTIPPTQNIQVLNIIVVLRFLSTASMNSQCNALKTGETSLEWKTAFAGKRSQFTTNRLADQRDGAWQDEFHDSSCKLIHICCESDLA